MAKYDKPDISVILEHYGARKLPMRHGWASMKCPFHDDSHASASVSQDENAFCCFACQMKGDGYAIIMKKEGVTFHEAINIAKRIFDQSGKVLPQRSARGRGISRRSRDYNGTSDTRTIGRRARTANGS